MSLVNQKRTDNRVFERFSARFPAKFKDTRQSFGNNVVLRDASAQGARILSKDRLFINDKVDLEIEIPDGHSPMSLRGEVVWVKPKENQQWDVGIKLFRTELMTMSRLYKFVADEV